MKDIPLNAKVVCTDGPGGESTHVVANPVTRQVTYFVVREKAKGHTERLVPIERVTQTTHNLIQLDCTLAELAEIEPFVETHYIKSVRPDYYSTTDPVSLLPYSTPMVESFIPVQEMRIPPDQLAVRRGTGVEATDGWVGRVDEFIVDPASSHITHLVLREGHLWGKKELALPVSAIKEVFGETVYLSLDKKTVKNLPAIPVRRSVGWPDAKLELVVWIFEEVDKAEEALRFFKQLKRDHVIAAVRNAAVLVKDESGQLAVREAQDVDAKRGTRFGAITGALVGLLGGPVGAVIGAAAGAATGRVAARKIDMGFPDEYLKNLQDNLQPGNSALIALIEHEWTGEVTEALKQFGGQQFRQALPDDIVAQLLADEDSETT
jgi:uncharacterized membrane protein